MNTAKILLIAPTSYPPMNPEGYVNAKLIGLLSEKGCHIDFICSESYALYTLQPEDSALFFSNVKSINIVKCNDSSFNILKNKDKRTLSKIINCIFAICKLGLAYSSREVDWVYKATLLCDKLIKKTEYDFIYTYDHPSEYIGLYVAKKHGIKWVSTWNDPYPWADRGPAPYGNGPHSKLSRVRELLIKKMSKHLYRVVFPSSRLRDYMLQYMKVDISRCVVSPHLISTKLKNHVPVLNQESLRFIHAGSLGNSRNPMTLFQGISQFIQKNPTANVKFDFLGAFYGMENVFKQQIEALKIESIVRFLPPVSYSDSLGIFKEYHICVIIEANLEEGIFLPSKLSDYLQSQKTILTISPTIGCLHDDYLAGIIDYFADVKSPNEIENEIHKIYADYEMNAIGKSNKDLSKYSEEVIHATHVHQIFS